MKEHLKKFDNYNGPSKVMGPKGNRHGQLLHMAAAQVSAPPEYLTWRKQVLTDGDWEQNVQGRRTMMAKNEIDRSLHEILGEWQNRQGEGSLNPREKYEHLADKFKKWIAQRAGEGRKSADKMKPFKLAFMGKDFAYLALHFKQDAEGRVARAAKDLHMSQAMDPQAWARMVAALKDPVDPMEFETAFHSLRSRAASVAMPPPATVPPL